MYTATLDKETLLERPRLVNGQKITASGNAGPNVLQGPHQGAQKSTTIGEDFDASMTSSMNVSSLTSLIKISSELDWLSSSMNHLLIFSSD